MTDVKHDVHVALTDSRVILKLRIFSEPRRHNVEMYASTVTAFVDPQNNVLHTSRGYSDWLPIKPSIGR